METNAEEVNVEVYEKPMNGEIYDNYSSAMPGKEKGEAKDPEKSNDLKCVMITTIIFLSVIVFLLSTLVILMGYHIYSSNSDNDDTNSEVRALESQISIFAESMENNLKDLKEKVEENRQLSEDLKTSNEMLSSRLENIEMKVQLMLQSSYDLDANLKNYTSQSKTQMAEMKTDLQIEYAKEVLSNLNCEINDNFACNEINSSMSLRALQERIVDHVWSLEQKYNNESDTCEGEFERLCGESENPLYCLPLVQREWTTIQRRMNFDVSFEKSFAEYEDGFSSSNPDGDFWLGLQTLHHLTTTTGMTWVMRTDFESWNDDKHYWIEYTGFSVGDPASKYKLTLGTQTGGSVTESSGWGWSYHDGMMFSANDADNDQNSGNCAETHKGGWWYNGCYRVNLNNLHATSDSDNFNHMQYRYSSSLGWLRLKNSIIRIKPQ